MCLMKKWNACLECKILSYPLFVDQDMPKKRRQSKGKKSAAAADANGQADPGQFDGVVVGLVGEKRRHVFSSVQKLPAELKSVAAALCIGVKQLDFSDKDAKLPQHYELAVNLAIRDVIAWACRMMKMLYIRYVHRSVAITCIDWRMCANAISRCSDIELLSEAGRPLMLARCDVETDKMAEGVENTGINMTMGDIVDLFYSKIVLFGRVIWDFKDENVNIETTTFLANHSARFLLLSLESSDKSFVPFIGTEISPFGTLLPVPQYNVTYIERMADAYDQPNKQFCPIYAIKHVVSPVSAVFIDVSHIRYVSDMIMAMTGFNLIKCNFINETARRMLELALTRNARSPDIEITRQVARSALWWTDAMPKFHKTIGANPRVCAFLFVNSFTYESLKAAFDLCLLFSSAEGIKIETGNTENYGINGIDVYTELFSSMPYSAQETLAGKMSPADSVSNARMILMLILVREFEYGGMNSVSLMAVKILDGLVVHMLSIYDKMAATIVDGDMQNMTDDSGMPTFTDVDTAVTRIVRCAGFEGTVQDAVNVLVDSIRHAYAKAASA